MALFNITHPESIINPLFFSSRKVKIQFFFIAVCKYNILSSWLGKAPQLNHLVQHCLLVTGTSLHNNNLTAPHFQAIYWSVLKWESYFTAYLLFIEIVAKTVWCFFLFWRVFGQEHNGAFRFSMSPRGFESMLSSFVPLPSKSGAWFFVFRV